MTSSMVLTDWKISLLSAVLLSSVACTTPILQRDETVPPVIPAPSGASEDRRVLAGEWDYEDGAVVTLTLDEQGNGAYPWKEGRFETRSLSDHTWQGMWFQKENDREGGFTVQFSPDFSDGEGRWWYTRIGTDQAPTQKGGTFRLSRKSSQVSAGQTPPAP
jgi:hypothetical protein